MRFRMRSVSDCGSSLVPGVLHARLIHAPSQNVQSVTARARALCEYPFSSVPQWLLKQPWPAHSPYAHECRGQGGACQLQRAAENGYSKLYVRELRERPPAAQKAGGPPRARATSDAPESSPHMRRSPSAGRVRPRSRGRPTSFSTRVSEKNPSRVCPAELRVGYVMLCVS